MAPRRRPPTEAAARDLRTLIDGGVFVDEPACRAMGRDFGGVVRRVPSIVVRPTRAADVARTLHFAARAGLPVSARGAGHSQGGQSLSDDGICVDLSVLRGESMVDSRRRIVRCQSGTLWLDVLRATLARALRPPVLTDNVFTTVGGTHAVGGIGAASHGQGMQIDHCEALTVAHPSGELVRCSMDENRDMFEHSLGGLGQLGIITEVAHCIEPVGGDLLSVKAVSTDVAALFDAAQSMLASGDRVCATLSARQRRGRVIALLNGSAPTGTQQARAISDVAMALSACATIRIEERDAVEHMLASVGLRGDRLERPLPPPAAGATWASPSVEGILPVAAAKVVALSICHAPLADCFRDAVVIVLFLDRERLSRPLAPAPPDRALALVGFYPIIVPSAEAAAVAMLDSLGAQLIAAGGRRYLPGLLPANHDWPRQFGAAWPSFQQLKAAVDPTGTMNPGIINFGAPQTPPSNAKTDARPTRRAECETTP